MTAPSYANAAAFGPTPKESSTYPKTSGRDSQLEELSRPPPTSMTLIATLQLLAPLDTKTDIFLMTRSYVQNWLIWAYHQKISKVEAGRVEAAVRLAADKLGLTPPSLNMDHTDPGPIDSSILSLQGFPLLLRHNVVVVDGTVEATPAAFEASEDSPLRRVKSLPMELKRESKEDDPTTHSFDEKDGHMECCAVPERFYETLRSVHGVICDDGFSVSFQPFPKDSDVLLHHHALDGQTDEDEENGSGRPRPIEFRRKVIVKQAPAAPSTEQHPISPMAKLLKEEEKRSEPRMIPVVEAHPVKLNYSIVDGISKHPSRQGFVLVSERALVHDTLQALMKVAAPLTSSSSRRVWSKRGKHGTDSGDGYEVVHLDSLDGKLMKKEVKPAPPIMLVGEWIRTHGEVELIKDFQVLVETKPAKGDWPRAPLELENRIKVGDFVDAQDAAGKWYEALVEDVTEDSVTVHYFGWASKWNGNIRRRRVGDVEGVSVKIHAPAPLWSHSSRWREKMADGKILEVRDASSHVNRPKWYKGIVRRIAIRGEKLKPVIGGAVLELFEIPKAQQNGNKNKDKRPLLLLGRKLQALVEIEQERQSQTQAPSATASAKAASASLDDTESVETFQAQPPFLRWVQLFGEEVCEAGTHMKIEPDEDLAVVTLRYEFEQGRKPVEIMKSWNNMYGSGFMKESLRGSPPAPGSVGMHNLGNSCFLNSIIQCLNHMDQITHYFLKGNYQQDLNRRNPLGSGGHVATAYSALMREIWGGKFSALAPRLLKQTVAMFAPQFNNSYQHDSQEFCQFLMDGLHEDCNRVKEKPYVEELEGFGMEDEKAAIETWRKHLLRHDSIIVDHCQGMHRSHLTCPGCGRESIKFDVFSTISLPLAREKGHSSIRLEDCIEKFMEGEQLDELNAWYCPSCKKHVCALKMIALWSVPDILILHLKRFTFDQCAISNEVVRSKIDDTVKFPIEGLDLRKHVLGKFDENAPPIYRLMGVSEHTGATANSGHYTATVRNSKDGRWYRYNDAHVGETTGDASVTGGAYVLFYQRAKGSDKWAGMKKVMEEREVDPYGGLETDQDGFTKVKKGRAH